MRAGILGAPYNSLHKFLAVLLGPVTKCAEQAAAHRGRPASSRPASRPVSPPRLAPSRPEVIGYLSRHSRWLTHRAH